ncbi:MAG: UDP-N-acetylmuramoyl-L-alanine--D-glutamate ligase [Jatrophihabitans sp.]
MASADPAGVAGRHALVCGYGVAGRSAADALIAAGADVAVTVDGILRAATAVVSLGSLDHVPDGFDLVVASPGFAPTHPVLADAVARGIEVWGEVELAWRLRGPDAAPWLALTGTNGKTTTVHMLESMLRAAGLRALAVGNVGESVIDAVLNGPANDVLAVELSSQQLHFAASIRPAAGALLNLAPDHLGWHGSLEAYELAKTGVWAGPVAIANGDDPRVQALAPAGAVPFTLGAPPRGGFGVADGALVSSAFGDDRAVLAQVSEVRPAGRHNVANALAAAALARAYGLPADGVAKGLRAFVPDPHRNQFVLTHQNVTWVDDSKATNPHAASASLHAYPRVVWVAGGQLKGVSIDALVAEVADRLVAVVLLGQDREQVASALSRHAPDVPVISVDSTDDGAMTEVVCAAAGFARPGDTVLLAPAAASYDMYSGFGARGDAFATAVRALVESS